ncbi:Uncharacterised protein [Vibrio cholerae]|nr:Uncharacterised protein [Vibrio cholerae]CSI59415.1 Uncharacterised protein [Vibrio cholerae]
MPDYPDKCGDGHRHVNPHRPYRCGNMDIDDSKTVPLLVIRRCIGQTEHRSYRKKQES